MRKVVVAGVSALSIVAGSAAVAFVVPGGIAGAQDSGGTTTTGKPARTPAGGKVLDDALAALVQNGTLTESQAAAVKAKLGETAKARMGEKLDAAKARMGEKLDAAKAQVGAGLDEIAKYLGTDVATLREQLRTKSLGEIAGTKRAGLITMLTDMANARIDEAVTRGALTAEQAASMKAKTGERVTQMVDAAGGKLGGRPSGRPGARTGGR